MFRYVGQHIVNYQGKVLDVYRGQDQEGQNVIVYKKHNGLNQKWRIVYVDSAPKDPTKGLNSGFGFHINRPFVLVSQLPANRYLYHHANNYLYIVNPTNPPAAQCRFVFDQVTKTVQSAWRKRYALEIMNNGNSNTAYMRGSINSRWW